MRGYATAAAASAAAAACAGYRAFRLPSSVAMAPYRSGRRSRNMPQLQGTVGQREGRAWCDHQRAPSCAGTGPPPSPAALNRPDHQHLNNRGAHMTQPHPARFMRHSSRSNVAVTKPSACSGSGSMPPFACLPRAPACRPGRVQNERKQFAAESRPACSKQAAYKIRCLGVAGDPPPFSAAHPRRASPQAPATQPAKVHPRATYNSTVGQLHATTFLSSHSGWPAPFLPAPLSLLKAPQRSCRHKR